MSSTATHYEILNLPTTPGRPFSPSGALKAAFHAALLAHHPDKAAPSTTTPTPPRSIDEITLAFHTLRDPRARAAYDKSLLLALPKLQFQAGGAAAGEVVDLDEMEWDARAREWSCACRCGMARGYVLLERDLEAEVERGEVGVPCAGCSLVLRVGFQVGS
ncbi:MAG: hypothetical protein M1829_004310 [Trizodia sp. TS-e1964]|nr:MAG: hypothetical protein M1829_004310 [Trizodia sp. TS-e1964]